ncbi:MAG: PD40 domain-containing protein [Planctomycetes bacterium]|nr:PD40 domain-containing protein [Planctomycetota bacterium]
MRMRLGLVVAGGVLAACGGGGPIPHTGVPAGDLVAFLQMGGTDVPARLWVSDASGAARRDVTPAATGTWCGVDDGFSWSPDRSRLLFRSKASPTSPYRTYVLAAGASTATPVDDGDPTLDHYDEAWSPDGSRFAFVGYDVVADASTLFVAPADGGPALAVSPTVPAGLAGVISFLWAPTGDRLMFSGEFLELDRDDVWTVSPDGSGLLAVSPVAGPGLQGVDRFGERAWSPDGTKVLFRASYAQFAHFDVCVVGWDGSGFDVLSDPTKYDSVWDFKVSPDGSRVAFRARTDKQGFTDIIDLFSVPLAGGATIELADALTLGADEVSWRYEWAPGGARIAFETTDELDALHDANALHTVDGAGGALATLAVPGGGFQLLGTSAFAWSPDGSRLAFGLRVDDPQDGIEDHVFLATANGVLLEELEPAPMIGNDRVEEIVWSPTGSAFVVRSNLNFGGSPPNYMHQVYDRGSGAWHSLGAFFYQLLERGAGWSADGSTVVVTGGPPASGPGDTEYGVRRASPLGVPIVPLTDVTAATPAVFAYDLAVR